MENAIKSPLTHAPRDLSLKGEVKPLGDIFHFSLEGEVDTAGGG